MNMNLQVPASMLKRNNVQYEFAGEFRVPRLDEMYFDGTWPSRCEVPTTQKYLILKKCWEPPEWLKFSGLWVVHVPDSTGGLVHFFSSEPHDTPLSGWVAKDGQAPFGCMDFSVAVMSKTIPPEWENPTFEGERKLHFEE